MKSFCKFYEEIQHSLYRLFLEATEPTQSREERRQDIIQRHLYAIKAKHNGRYYLINAVNDCLRDIAEVEGVRLKYAPRGNGRGDSQDNLSKDMAPEYHSLLSFLKTRFRAQLDEQRRQEEAIDRAAYAEQQWLEQQRKQVEMERRVGPLIAKYSQLIRQFYVVVERKVSLRDEYGDENWDVLDKEIAVVLRKIAKKEGYVGGYLGIDVDNWFAEFLKQSFRKHHQNKRAQPIARVDFSAMSGEGFEAYLMDLLCRLGYAVCGTKATGDQGADVLATKDGRVVIIQAKNYRGTVGNAAVQEVTAAVRFYSGDEGWVVTNSMFTAAARELAQRTGVRLIDGHELACMTKSQTC